MVASNDMKMLDAATAVSPVLAGLSSTDEYGIVATGADGQTKMKLTISPWWMLLSTVSGAASAYHGYKRNESVGWAVGWFFLGSMFPVITPTIAVAQGFGKRKRS